MSRPSNRVGEPIALDIDQVAAVRGGNTPEPSRATTMSALAPQFRLFFADDTDPHILARCRDGRMMLVNPAAVEATGFSEAKLLAGTMADLFDEDDATRASFAATLKRDGCLKDIERYIVISDGSHVRVQFSATQVVVDGEVHALVTLCDISDLDAAESALHGIHRAQSSFISQPQDADAFGELLEAMLKLSGSRFGFIASADADDAALNIRALGAASGQGGTQQYRLGGADDVDTASLEAEKNGRPGWARALKHGFYGPLS